MHRAVLAMSLVAIAATLAALPGAATGATPTNVDVSQRLGNESEEAIAVNPTNPSNIVVFTNIGHTEVGLTAGMFLAVSFDGGTTWTKRLVGLGTHDSLGDSCCDPSLSFDQYGNLFMTYLYQTENTVPVALSTDGGLTFNIVTNVVAPLVHTLGDSHQQLCRLGALQIALAGESAGGGLAAATLLALREAGVPLPSCGYLMSPYADLTLSGETLVEKQDVDPLLTNDGLRARVPDYVGGADASDPLISPIFGDLRELPPLLIQVGSHEILLSDAIRLAARAATADVAVTLDVVPGVPHVFQAYAAVLDEGDAALDRAATFVTANFADTHATPAT